MENEPNHIGALFETSGDYLETRVDLLKLKAVNKSSDMISSIVSKLVITLIFIFGFFILNIGLSIWIGTKTGEVWYGFIIVAGFYILLGVLLIIFKGKWLKDPVNNILVKKMLN